MKKKNEKFKKSRGKFRKYFPQIKKEDIKAWYWNNIFHIKIKTHTQKGEKMRKKKMYYLEEGKQKLFRNDKL
jgi:broad specificity polyphosphatase/5'/3'-nucleotidase SurE